NFIIDNAVSFIPINALPEIPERPEGYVIIGNGKTGMDACLWLLKNGVDPNEITWIVSRDAWLLDRQNTQTTDAFFEQTMGTLANQFEVATKASSIQDLFQRLEAVGALVRIDQTIQPQLFRGATVSQVELKELRRIKNVIRLGRVQHLKTNQIILEKGTLPTSVNHIHVDCSASAISGKAPKPIFEEERITPQFVRPYQPVFSASFIAYVESNYEDLDRKNALCQVVPLPTTAESWIDMMLIQILNQATWQQDIKLLNWMLNNRLNAFGDFLKNLHESDKKRTAILERIRENSFSALVNLKALSEQSKSSD
ncbi:MAG: NAD(P)/FAD-dependent oxidoreductase, partial [Bacteroidota bacterium]